MNPLLLGGQEAQSPEEVITQHLGMRRDPWTFDENSDPARASWVRVHPQGHIYRHTEVGRRGKARYTLVID